ncbi:MAG: ABC transporter permease subunit [Thermoleophilia bacterium]
MLTAVFLGLYWLAARRAFSEVGGFARQALDEGVETATLAGATLLGLSMFATLFLGTILVVFLTLGAVRGDAERGLLQPLVARPLGRTALLVARLVGAGACGGLYVAVVYAACVVITRQAGGWTPDRLVLPALELVGAVVLVAAISILGSVFLSGTANGIAVFMVFGAGLTAGLLGQVGEAIGSETLIDVARITSWVLPFEALYQDGLGNLTADTRGLTRLAVDLGPFGGAQSVGPGFAPYVLAYLAGLVGLSAWAFARRDL